MTIPTHNAPARSQFFQLLALGFAHPIAELHELLCSGSYQRTLAQAAHDGFGIEVQLTAQNHDFVDFEASYIDLFQVGQRGKPQVSLNAGDHDQLSRDHSRPEFLLLYTGWYKHFGLQINGEEGANELPDHLVCQLEFLAWLTHLETRASNDTDLLRGYMQAQKDFCERQLQPFLELLVNSLQQHKSSRLYLELAALTLESANMLLAELPAHIDDGTTRDEAIPVVNLWG